MYHRYSWSDPKDREFWDGYFAFEHAVFLLAVVPSHNVDEVGCMKVREQLDAFIQKFRVKEYLYR